MLRLLFKKSLCCLIIFSFLSLEFQQVLASGSKRDADEEMARAMDGGAGHRGRAVPVAREDEDEEPLLMEVDAGHQGEVEQERADPIGLKDGVEGALATILRTNHWRGHGGRDQYKSAGTIVTYEHGQEKETVMTPTNNVKLARLIDDGLFNFVFATERPLNLGCCRLDNTLKATGAVVYVAAAPAIVALCTYAFGDTIALPRSGVGELLGIIVYNLALLPTLARLGYERGHKIYDGLVSRRKGAAFATRGDNQDVPMVRSISGFHRFCKVAVFGASAIWALGPYGVFTLFAENLGMNGNATQGNKIFVGILSLPILSILTEINYRMGVRALGNAFNQRVYAGAPSTEIKRKIIERALKDFRDEIAKDKGSSRSLAQRVYNLIRQNRPHRQGIIDDDRDGRYLSLLSLLMLRPVDPVLDFGRISREQLPIQGDEEEGGVDERSPLINLADGLLDERDDFALKLERYKRVVEGMNSMEDERSWWGAIRRRVTSVVMGISGYVGWRTLEYVTQSILEGIGVDSATSSIVANVFSGLATATVTAIAWEELELFFKFIPKIFSKKRNYKPLRWGVNMHAAINAALLSLVEILLGNAVFGADPLPSRVALISMSYLRSLGLYYMFFDRSGQDTITGATTLKPYDAQSLRKKVAVLTDWNLKAAEFIKRAKPNTIEMIFYLFIENKPEE